MSDKNITELEWKKFAKGKGYKDAAFVKALAALELGKTPEAKLAALDAIEKEGDALRKANKADKELGSYLDDAEKAAGKERKLQEMEAKKAAKQSASEEDEDDSPAALTGKMIPLLRQVRKGDVMKAMVAVTGKEVAVLVSKKPIGPPKRKLLTDYLGVSGGVKFAVGEVIWEENAHTFVLSTQAAGLAKKIKAALYKQVEQRFKVRVRGEDPDDIDDDGEPNEEAEQQERENQDGPKAESNIPEAPPLPPTAEQPAPKQEAVPQTDEAAAFNARLAALMPKVKEAIVAAGPNATDVKLKVSEAGVAARKKEFGNANALLDEAEQLLSRAASAPAAPAATAAVPKGFVNQARSRIAWQQLRQKVKGDLDKLERAILEDYKAAPNADELATKIRRFDTVLTTLDESLADTLDAALNASDMAERVRLHGEARAILARYIDFVANDPLLRALDGNPFVPLTTHETLTKSLKVLDNSLA